MEVITLIVVQFTKQKKQVKIDILNFDNQSQGWLSWNFPMMEQSG
jgi:hypothetical protein